MRHRFVSSTPIACVANVMFGTLVTLATLATLAGCGSSQSIDGEGAAQATGTSWEKRLQCENGSAVLDADRAYPKKVQFVIRDRGVVDYLSSRADHLQNTNHEIVFQGFASHPIDSAKSFDLFEDTESLGGRGRQTVDAKTFTYQREVARVARIDGEGRIRVDLLSETQTHRCSGYVEEVYCRNGEWAVETARTELANWVFRDCQ